jgi:hypothetical protein
MKSSSGLGVSLVHALLFFCASVCSAAAVAQSYRVHVDTRALAGTAGYIDLQLNPADLQAPDMSAWVLDWSGATLLSEVTIEGSVTGMLPDSVTLTNDTAFNDYFQSVEFGDSLSFIVQFEQDGNAWPNIGTSFALALYAADAMTPLLTNDISGSIVRFEVLNGAINYQTFSPGGASPSLAQVAPVPLPAAAWLLLSGVAGLFGVTGSRSRERH